MRNAFTAGPAVHGEDFFGRSQLMASLLDSIAAGRASTLLIGESRIGKSSILRQLAHLTEKDTVSAVFFDAYAGTPDALAIRLGHSLESVAALGTRAAKAGEKGLFYLLRLLESSRDRLTIMIDEVDGIVSDKESARFIRAVASMGHKLVIATSRIDPVNHETHPDEPVWWNVFRIQYVGLFTESEARDMLLTLSERSGQRFSVGECSFLLDVMGGYPFLLQWLGHEIFSRGFRECTTAQKRQLLKELAGDDSLFQIIGSYYDEWLGRLDEKQLSILISSASSDGIAPNPTVASLKNRGLLIEGEDGRWHPFSRLFDEFLRAIPKGAMLSADVKSKIWQALFPAVKTVFEVAAKHYL